MEHGSAAAVKDIENDFDRYFHAAQLMGDVPEGAFADIDRARLKMDVLKRIGRVDKKGSLAGFIEARRGSEWFPRLIIGSGAGRMRGACACR